MNGGARTGTSPRPDFGADPRWDATGDPWVHDRVPAPRHALLRDAGPALVSAGPPRHALRVADERPDLAGPDLTGFALDDEHDPEDPGHLADLEDPDDLDGTPVVAAGPGAVARSARHSGGIPVAEMVRRHTGPFPAATGAPTPGRCARRRVNVFRRARSSTVGMTTAAVLVAGAATAVVVPMTVAPVLPGGPIGPVDESLQRTPQSGPLAATAPDPGGLVASASGVPAAPLVSAADGPLARALGLVPPGGDPSAAPGPVGGAVGAGGAAGGNGTSTPGRGATTPAPVTPPRGSAPSGGGSAGTPAAPSPGPGTGSGGTGSGGAGSGSTGSDGTGSSGGDAAGTGSGGTGSSDGSSGTGTGGDSSTGSTGSTSGSSPDAGSTGDRSEPSPPSPVGTSGDNAPTGPSSTSASSGQRT